MPETGLTTGQCFENILQILAEKGIFTFVSSPNIDHGHEEILSVIERYRKHPNFHFYHNLIRNDFVNLLRHAAFLIGNSSAGIIEGPALRLPVINVGNRQRGRVTSQNVIFVDGRKPSIQQVVEQIDSETFRVTLGKTISIYGDGHSTEKAHQLLQELDYREFLFKNDDPLRT
jgi:UDP-N-acetylglucosamine 2-epimerase